MLFVTLNDQFHESAQIQQAILERQSQRKETFRQVRENYILDESAKEILTISAMDLIEKLQKRSLNATQVLHAYMARAIAVQDQLNCITEFVPFALVCFEIRFHDFVLLKSEF